VTAERPADSASPLGPLALLALLLGTACGLAYAGMIDVVGNGGTERGFGGFAFALTLFLVTAAASSVRPRDRFNLLLGASLLQVLVLLGPLKGAGALAIYAAFYLVASWRGTWWLKAPALVLLVGSPFILSIARPGSRLVGLTVAAMFTGNFILRSALYLYESTTRAEPRSGAGFKRFLLHLLALPMCAIKVEPVGFLVLQRGFREEFSPSLFKAGTRQMALGFLYLTIQGYAFRSGLIPTQAALADAADELNALTALAGCHLQLLNLFLVVAGHIHIAMGMMRVLGFDIPQGSDRPYEARNVLDLWKRWNTYYRDYLLTLVYYPVVIALKKKPYIAIATAGLLTFLFSGFSHALANTIPNPSGVTPLGFLRMHQVFLAQGCFVIVWMLLTASKRKDRASRGAAGAKAPARLFGAKIFVAVSVAVTLTVMAVNIILFSPRIGFPDPAASRIMAALLRPPW